MKVTLLYFGDCPNWQATDALLQSLKHDVGFDLERCRVETAEDAERWQFRGSPTVLIDGRDPFAIGDEPVGLSCRMYRTDDGLAGGPPEAQLRGLLVAASATSDVDNTNVTTP